MRKLKGKVHNFKRETIGRIVYNSVDESIRPDSILIVDNPTNADVGYGGILTKWNYASLSNDRSIDSLVYCDVDNLDLLQEGDVVLLQQNGEIIVLFERESDDNVLMLTEQCNCSCLMCPQAITKKPDDKTEVNLKLIELIDKSTKFLAITGGEPTLLAERFLQIIEFCKEHLSNTSLDILTNGIKFSNFEFAKKLTLIDHPNLTIAISLYGDTDSEHNHIVQTRGFYKTIECLYNLALLKQKVEIRIVIHALTYKRLPHIAEFIYHNFPFVIHVAFMGMEIRESAIINLDKLWIDPADYIPELELAVTYLNRRDINTSIYNLPLCILPKKLWSFSRKSISSWKIMFLDECKNCIMRNECGGFFNSPINKRSRYIHPLV